MDFSKRQMLKELTALSVGGAIMPLSAVQIKGSREYTQDVGNANKRYGMFIDLRRCIGCQACTMSCSIENQTPLNSFRTTVRTYEVVNEQQTAIALLPRLCNHCENAPCIPVCPVEATFQRKDGIVVVNNDRCIGCAYCVQACPYDARFINHDTKTADKCTFCAHRLDVGLLPACVESCVGGARVIGDLKDPNSEISQLVKTHEKEIKVLKPEEGTVPYVFYLGLDDAFVSKIQGKPMLWQGLEEEH